MMAIHHWAPLGSNGKVVQFLWHSRWPNCHIALHWCRFSETTRSTAAACRSSPSPTSRPVSDSSSVPRSSFSLLSGAPPFVLFLLAFKLSLFHLLLIVIVIVVSRRRLGPEATGCVKCAHCHHLPSPAPPPAPPAAPSPADQEAEVSVWEAQVTLSEWSIYLIPESCDQINRCVLNPN